MVFKEDNNATRTKISGLDEKINQFIQIQYHRKFGRCYTFYPQEKIRKTVGIYYIKFKL